MISELQKCKDSPAYFYNNYTTQGKLNPVNGKEWDLLIKYADRIIFRPARQYNSTGQLLEVLKEIDRNSLTE